MVSRGLCEDTKVETIEHLTSKYLKNCWEHLNKCNIMQLNIKAETTANVTSSAQSSIKIERK